MSETITRQILEAVRNSRNGIARLDILESLKLTDKQSLKIILSRLNGRGQIIRLKRGVYSDNPMHDAFACAQATFNGYIGLYAALYLQKMIDEIPFVVHVITRGASAKKTFGHYEFVAVALKEKAVGFERAGEYIVSTRAKTLFDLLYLQKQTPGKGALLKIARNGGIGKKDVEEFEGYVEKYCPKKRVGEMKEFLHGLKKGVRK